MSEEYHKTSLQKHIIIPWVCYKNIVSMIRVASPLPPVSIHIDRLINIVYYLGILASPLLAFYLLYGARLPLLFWDPLSDKFI